MSAELELRQEPNPNLVTFEEHYHRRLRLPVRFNFEVQTKLAMFRRLAQNMPPLPEGAHALPRTGEMQSAQSRYANNAAQTPRARETKRADLPAPRGQRGRRPQNGDRWASRMKTFDQATP